MTNLTATHNLSKIVAASITKVSTPFKQPMLFKGHNLCSREGYRLKLHFSDGTIGKGEASPLPGFSQESLNDCLLQLKQVLAPLNLNQPIDLSKADAPSVAFALDCALSKTSYEVDSMTLPNEMPLLIGSNQTIVKEYKQLGKPDRIKLKAARQAPSLDAALVNQLHQLNPALKCILDANQAWTAQDADEFANRIPCKVIAYIEEPCATYDDTMGFFKTTGIPVALDETLQNKNFKFHPQAGIAALVIKPSLIGSFARCQRCIEVAKQHNIQTYLSSSFESPMAIKQLAYLAQCWTPNQPAGLDTIKYLDIDKLTLTPIAQWPQKPCSTDG